MLAEMLPPGEVSAGPAGHCCRLSTRGLLRQPPPGSCPEQLAHLLRASPLPGGNCSKQLVHLRHGHLQSGAHAVAAAAAAGLGAALLLAARAAATSGSHDLGRRRPGSRWVCAADTSARRSALRLQMACQSSASGVEPAVDASGSGSNSEAGGHQQMEEGEEQLLRGFFDHQSWRSGQQEVVKAVLQKQDVLLNWSTGAGKSLCYQLPAVLAWQRHKGLTVVVEPLISLMRDQVLNFNALSSASDAPRATFLGSGQSDASMDQRALEGEFCLVYLTPEKLTEGLLLLGLEQLSRSGRLELVVMDEAACISLWGHDFRPSFRNMWWVREQYPQVPFMALSASMTEDMRRDISDQLRLRDPFVSTLPYFRRNLDIACTHKEGFRKDMARIAEAIKPGELTIVYVPQPSTAVKVAAKLESLLEDRGIQVGVYTGATEKGERERVQSAFDRDELQVLVATVAFGMGIDKADVRNIIHYGLPKCMEDYHQQIGRAGRDGLPSRCVTLFGNSDWKLWFSRYFTQEYKHWDKEDLKRHLESTEHLYQLVAGHGCRQQAILAYFGRTAELEVLKSSRICRCDVCLGRRGLWLGTSPSAERRDFFREARLVLEAVRVAQDCISGDGVSKEAVLRLVNGRSDSGFESAMVAFPKAAVMNFRLFRDELPLERRTQPYVSEIFDMLYGDGYLTRRLSSTEDLRSFVWRLTDVGESTLAWGKPIPLLPTSQLRKLDMGPQERKGLEQMQRMYSKDRRTALNLMPYYLRELRNPTAVEDPNDERDMWDRLASMSDSMQALAAKAGETVKAEGSIKGEGGGGMGMHSDPSTAEACTANLHESLLAVTPSSKGPAAIRSDLDGPLYSSHSDLLFEVLGLRLQRTLQMQDVIFEYPMNSSNATVCVITLPALQGIQFSTCQGYKKRSSAKKHSIEIALRHLIAMPSPSFTNGTATPKAEMNSCSMSPTDLKSSSCQFWVPFLQWCIALHVHHPPRREGLSFSYFQDSNKECRCVVTVRALEGVQFSTATSYLHRSSAKLSATRHACNVLLRALSPARLKIIDQQMSRLLACLAKHMQSTPVEEDVELSYPVDANKAYRCVITVPALAGIQFSNSTAQRLKSAAKLMAIRRACGLLTAAPSVEALTITCNELGSAKRAGAGGKQVARLLACLAKHMHGVPRVDDIKFCFSLDGNNAHQCVISVPALGSVQFSHPTLSRYKGHAKQSAIYHACKSLMAASSLKAFNGTPAKAVEKSKTLLSRLLECLSKHMQRAPTEEDVEFSYVVDSSNAYQCVISVPALGGMQFSHQKLQRIKSYAKRNAIRLACRVLKKMQLFESRIHRSTPAA
ncbi:unnamed protein product [Polarella glacialis]|uniref:DNA 3'-5' helicase n=2 Tax=Polarella glacialis TaxID=89957 RepID=A0A813LIZ3_POLGL|nr:unnamed protein product [Polarella glacialis]